MRTAALLPGFAFTCFIAGASLQSRQPQDPPPSDIGRRTIVGRVVADDTGVPLPNARVILDGSSDPPVLTDKNGRFELITAAQTAHTVSASKTGYATAQAPLDTPLVMRLLDGAAISGSVVDDYGAPLPLITIVAERRVAVNGSTQFERQSSGVTNDRGQYRLFDLSPGGYVVSNSGSRVFLPGLTPILGGDRTAGKYYPDASGANEAQVLLLRAGSEIADINFSIPLAPAPKNLATRLSRGADAGVIRGRVIGSEGFPSRRARVQLTSVQRLFSPFQTISDDNGQFEFTEVTAGQYRVSASDLRFQSASFGQRRFSDPGEIITLTPGATSERIDIEMPRTNAIAGRIVDELGDPVDHANARVQQVRWSGGRGHLVTVGGGALQQTDDLGRFRIFGLPPGEYFVSAAVGLREPGAESIDLPGYLRTYFPGTALVTQAQQVELVEGRDVSGVEIMLVRGHGARLSGHIFRADGEPFSGAVHLMPSNRSRACAFAMPMRMATEDGSFDFDDLLPGEYVVQAATSREGVSTEGEFGIQFATVGADGNDVTIKMSAGSSVAGRVTFEGAAPRTIGDVEISPVPADVDFASLASNPVAQAEIHADGSFEMHGLNGPWRLRLTHAPTGWTLKGIYANGIEITDAPMTFGSSDQSISNVEIVLTDRITEVAGQVKDDRGRPVSAAVVVAFATDRSLWYPTSRFAAATEITAGGTFKLRDLPPDDYYIVALDERDISNVITELDDPEFLDRLAVDAPRISVMEGGHAELLLKLIPMR